jgi:hypothetical protein
MRNSLLTLLLTSTLACAPQTPEPSGTAVAPAVTPSYNASTGRLEQLTADRNADGKIDTWAFMDGVRLQRIEIDRDADGRPDRWEHYEDAPPGQDAPGGVRLTTVEERHAPEGIVTRREFYTGGVLERVEEDTSDSGRINKWEFYTGGVLARVELDLAGRGTADQRLLYGPTGEVERVERDPDGDGRFEPAPQDLARR